MSTDDRSEENRTMDEAESPRAADTTRDTDAGNMGEHTPATEEVPTGEPGRTPERSPSAAPASTEETPRLGEAVSPMTPPVPPAAATATEPAGETSYARPSGTTAYRRGPAVGTILLGLLCLAVAGFAFADRTLDLSVDWARVGPLGVLLGGAVLVLLGVLGMRRRRDS